MTASISQAIVGVEVGPCIAEIDARWLMAYAAGLGECDPRYFETRGADGPMAHPLFPVCYEWPVALALRAATIPDALAPLSVHATHHLTLARLPRHGDTLSTTGRVIGVRGRRSGTLVTSRFTTVDASGAPVSVTDYGSVYRGVATDGAHADGESRAAHGHEGNDALAVEWSEAVEVDGSAAHVYTECARIWNPIHTDVAVARAAGLPGIILHGTATLALAVSRVVRRDLDGDARGVHEIAGRFTGMVALPSRLTVRRRAGEGRAGLAFEAVDATGAAVLSGGRVGT
jgi:acyl dehydratase